MSRPDPNKSIRVGMDCRSGKITLPEETPPYPTILEFLTTRFPHIDGSIWRNRLMTGKIQDSDGAILTDETAYRPGKIVHYYRELESETKIPFKESIIFQNDQILVADKPHFLPVIPVGDYLHETLLYRLIKKTGLKELSPLHRLDRETAGLVIFSTDKANRAEYQKLFQSGQIKKIYQAIGRIPNNLSQDNWKIATGIVADNKWPLNKIVDHPINARTDISLVDTNGFNGLFRLIPKTGKTHQLRLHMTHINCPIVGDRFYPNFDPDFHISYDNPLQLIAAQLSFTDPISSDRMEFNSKLRLNWPVK